MEEDFELTLFDRLEVIRSVDKKYDLNKNSYISFSGGKDSTVLSHMIDLAIPNNEIPRVFINTGIEYNAIVGFVHDCMKEDPRITEIKPTKPIKRVLEDYGYPFKSKEHSNKVAMWQKGSRCPTLMRYIEGNNGFQCPETLKYQFSDRLTMKVSDRCCYKLKKEPVKAWAKENGKPISIIGIMQGEGGQRRNHSGCVVLNSDSSLRVFKPLNPVSKDFERWFINKYDIRLCELYYPPYSFERTGCKGCPYAVGLQEELAKMYAYLPNEAKQCEIIWKPVYDEYRRLGYRLEEDIQLRLF